MEMATRSQGNPTPGLQRDNLGTVLSSKLQSGKLHNRVCSAQGADTAMPGFILAAANSEACFFFQHKVIFIL